VPCFKQITKLYLLSQKVATGKKANLHQFSALKSCNDTLKKIPSYQLKLAHVPNTLSQQMIANAELGTGVNFRQHKVTTLSITSLTMTSSPDMD